MKRTISIILAALMLLSVLSITAMAANGPNPDKDEFGYYNAHIFFYNVTEDGGDVGIYYDNELKDTIEGAEYDKETNTLTLTDFDHPEFSLSLNDMGDDFKLNIQGVCILYRISVSTENYGGSLTVTGTGLLTVNPEKEDETAINFNADGADATLHVEDSVSVKFLSCYEAVIFQGTAHADKDTVFMQGEETVEVEGEKPTYLDYETVNGAYASRESDTELGYQAHQANDPNHEQGIYNVTISEDDEGNDVYHVERYTIDEKFGVYTKDESFEAQDLTKEEFDSQYVIETQPGTTPKTVEYTDDDGSTKTGFLVKDNDGNYLVIDIDYNNDDSDNDSIHRAKPIVEEAEGGYSVAATWAGYEVNRDTFFNIGLQYVMEDEKIVFKINSIVTDEYIVYEDEDGNRYVFDDDDNLYRVDENNTVTIDGEEYYILIPWQGVAEDNLKPVTVERESDYYDYEYTDEDYIHIAQPTPTEATDDEVPTTEETEDVTGDVPTESVPTTDAAPTDEPPAVTDATAAPTDDQQPTDNQQPTNDQRPTEAVTESKATTPQAKATEPTINEVKKGSSEKQVDKFVTALKTEKDVKGSTFGLLCAHQKKATKKAVTVTWNKLNNAKSYIVYGSLCGTKKGQIPPFKKMKKVTKNTFTKSGLKKGTYFKFLIVALDKNNKAVATSKTVHIATKGGKVGNDKTVKVNKSKVSLKAKKTFKIKAKEVAQSKKLKVKRHRKIKYESSNTKVAKVNGKGKITAKKKGKATIYVYAQNGLYKKIKVTVK